MPDSKGFKPNAIKINADIVRKARDYADELITKQLPVTTFCFHNVDHMEETLKYAEIIGNYHRLSNEEMNVLRISAIFHDTGYTKTYAGHEEEGAKIAQIFLQKHHVKESQIKKVVHTIMATKVPQKPGDVCSKILCDADLVNLTYDDYFKSAELIRQEWMNTGIAHMSESEFHNNSLHFFKTHTFHTAYGKKFLEPKKQQVYERILERQATLKG